MKNRIKNDLKRIIDKLYAQRRWLLAMSVLVVFITTYLLILPAFTLEKDKTEELGIDLTASETAADEIDGNTSEESAVERNAASDEKSADEAEKTSS